MAAINSRVSVGITTWCPSLPLKTGLIEFPVELSTGIPLVASN
jgi:hypothetical protein